MPHPAIPAHCRQDEHYPLNGSQRPSKSKAPVWKREHLWAVLDSDYPLNGGQRPSKSKTPAWKRESLWAVLNLSRTSSFPENRGKIRNKVVTFSRILVLYVEIVKECWCYLVKNIISEHITSSNASIQIFYGLILQILL
jgi:hypothetical protein